MGSSFKKQNYKNPVKILLEQKLDFYMRFGCILMYLVYIKGVGPHTHTGTGTVTTECC